MPGRKGEGPTPVSEHSYPMAWQNYIAECEIGDVWYYNATKILNTLIWHYVGAMNIIVWETVSNIGFVNRQCY